MQSYKEARRLPKDRFRVSVVGASGYSGMELTKLLLRHPGVQIGTLFANTAAGKRVTEIVPSLHGQIDAVFAPYSPEAACTSDLIFLALPSGEAMNLAPELLTRGKKLIDLGGDFRIPDAALYQKYYHRTHRASDLLQTAVYGLPEWNRNEIQKASLCANPGCYPTSAILPLAPLLKEGLIRDEHIIVNSLSGVSGAGRTAAPELSFVEVNESVRAYKVGVHQHTPEINSVLHSVCGRAVAATFVPHLIPITRGIYTTIYASLTQGVTESDIENAYGKWYAAERFVRFSSHAIPEIKNVAFTNLVDIGFRLDERSGGIVLFSAIDNLLKGAAGQAIQNMNLMIGLNESEGLL